MWTSLGGVLSGANNQIQMWRIQDNYLLCSIHSARISLDKVLCNLGEVRCKSLVAVQKFSITSLLDPSSFVWQGMTQQHTPHIRSLSLYHVVFIAWDFTGTWGGWEQCQMKEVLPPKSEDYFQSCGASCKTSRWLENSSLLCLRKWSPEDKSRVLSASTLPSRGASTAWLTPSFTDSSSGSGMELATRSLEGCLGIVVKLLH